MNATPTIQAKIRFRCPNGHNLVASAEAEGHAVSCPKCGRAIVVPTINHGPVTETGIVNLLETHPARTNFNIWT